MPVHPSEHRILPSSARIRIYAAPRSRATWALNPSRAPLPRTPVPELAIEGIATIPGVSYYH